MVWPTDTLTNANTDNPTDRPDLARDELNSSILMVKTILGEAPAGSVLLTDQDEGTGNGLDADTVDGVHASGLALASHNHSASNITSGTLVVARGGTGVTALTDHYALVGSGSGITPVTPSTSGRVLMSNGTGADPSFQDLPSFPTVDVLASDFYNGSVGVFADSSAYDFDTGFGDNNFQWGISGANVGGDFIIVGYQSTTKWQFMHQGDTDGITARMPNISAIAAGHIRFAINGIGGTITVYVWARKNI